MSRAKGKKKGYDRRVVYRLRKPWIEYICWAKRRCTDTRSKWFAFYGAKGITCTLTVNDGEFLWHRDKAHLLERPSLDRMDPTKGYTRENCQFIEFKDNSRIAWDPTHRDRISGVKAACGPLLPDEEINDRQDDRARLGSSAAQRA